MEDEIRKWQLLKIRDISIIQVKSVQQNNKIGAINMETGENISFWLAVWPESWMLSGLSWVKNTV